MVLFAACALNIKIKKGRAEALPFKRFFVLLKDN